jgi:hypothetical protein
MNRSEIVVDITALNFKNLVQINDLRTEIDILYK